MLKYESEETYTGYTNVIRRQWFRLV